MTIDERIARILKWWEDDGRAVYLPEPMVDFLHDCQAEITMLRSHLKQETNAGQGDRSDRPGISEDHYREVGMDQPSMRKEK